jgi:opacity protein-like surface antigen
MNKILQTLIIILFFSSIIYADNYSELIIGGSTAKDINEKVGLTTSFTFWNEFNYMFALGFNPSVLWFAWENDVYDSDGQLKTDTVVIGGEQVQQPVVDTANAFMFPLIVDAKVQYPVTEMFIPYAAAGMGYTIMPLLYDNESNDIYSGFSWQVHGGFAVKIPDINDFRFVGDIKYRNNVLRNENKVRIDMSGWTFSAGIQYGEISGKGRRQSDIVW